MYVRASPAVLSIWPCKNISHIQVLGIYLLPTLSIQLKLGLQIGRRLLVATHLDESNYLANQKQGAVNKYDLIVFIRLFQGSSRALEAVHFSRITAVCQWIHWIWLLHLILDFRCRATYLAPVEMLQGFGCLVCWSRILRALHFQLHFVTHELLPSSCLQSTH